MEEVETMKVSQQSLQRELGYFEILSWFTDAKQDSSMCEWSDLWRLLDRRCTCAMVYIWIVLVAMVNGVDRDEYREVSDVRPEFTFALESTTQHARPTGDKRTRSRHEMNDEEEGWNLEMSGSGNTTLKKIPRKLKELLESGLLEGSPVQYQYGPKTKGKSGLKGIVCGSGIACSCPDCHGTKVISPNEFEKHAHSRNKRPADYIYLENGNNLRAVLNACTNATLEALESIIQGMIGCTSSSAEQNVFCPICTSSISGEEMLCSSCKEISTHCALCRGHDFSTSEFGSRTIIFCDQCEKEYHVGCLKEHDMADLKELPEGEWFCCEDCSRIHSALEYRLGVGNDFLPLSLFETIQSEDRISWRLLNGRRSAYKPNEKSILLKAESIFHDRFNLVEDSNSGLGDFISHMVFGREVGDQDFKGMYCAVLKVNSKIVSAGIIRVFGEGMAEIPLIADKHQEQDYSEVLFSCLEFLLQSLQVKKLVLSAADGVNSWIEKEEFDFSNILEEELKNYQKDYQLVVFEGTPMLQKTIVWDLED